MKLFQLIITLLQVPYVGITGGVLLLFGAVLSTFPRLDGYERDHWVIKSGLYAALFGMVLVILYWVALACYPVHAPAIVGGFAIYTHNDMW